MKRILTLMCAVLVVASIASTSFADLIITALADPNGGSGDLVELYALEDIPDLSIYGVDTASNGGASTVPDFTFAAGTLAAGDFYYLTGDQLDFTQFFGFAADETVLGGINGDDSIFLYESGAVIDVFGTVPNVDLTGNALEYSDGFAYRNNNTSASGNASATVSDFLIVQDALLSSNDSTNAASPTPVPIGTFTTAVPEPSSLAMLGLLGLVGLAKRRRN